MDEAYEDAFVYDWTRGGLNLLGDRTRQFETHMFPLSVVGAGGWDLANWVQDYEKRWREAAETLNGAEAESAAYHAENAKKFGEHLKDITEQYQISSIELDRDLELPKVCDIFTQVNSRGVRPDIIDLLNALLRPKGIRLRQDLWREASPRLGFAEAARVNVYVLQVMSILREAYFSRSICTT